ncbi:RadC family protein [Dokdonia sp. Hel_I_53]|uniref:RadC family protein n=1 Tax=Dokdonia sp. Hel_I_53 TaxID=1566287 RepID=UPI0011AB1FE4|nr:DNA repair protein RadC [Dokdonia sp. Hel_I_53]
MEDEHKNFSIKNWSEDDRPREKLVIKGRSSLSNAELIAILISSGSREESAVSLSKRILASVENNLSELGKISIKDLMKFKGIGEAKAVSIAAALELGRRRGEGDTLSRKRISSSKDAYQMLQPMIGDLSHEEFWVLFLSNSNKVLRKEQVSKGGLTGTLVDIRMVLKTALEYNAVGMILGHNHPSGTLKPSQADILLTNKLKTAAQGLDIQVLDHIIVTEKTYFSFADDGIL